MRQKLILTLDARNKPYPHRFVLEDYVWVNTIDTYGSWTVRDLLPVACLGRLARWTNEMEAKR